MGYRNTNNMSLPKDPFGELALCLSGGGYRAASFHLGSMHYLNRIKYKKEPLLEKVSALSTVSGGTITGVVYALMVNQGFSFDDVYNHLMDFLHNHDLIHESLKKLNPDGEWDSDYKSRNLINAFAEIYDHALLDKATFKKITELRNSHLRFVCFNSTEFTTGINFRFQCEWRGNNQNKLLRRGNGNFTFSFNAFEEIKLADVIAASSCFPGGFEPLNFPFDFMHKDAIALQNLKDHNSYSEGLGLMDGGIYDNQGIDAIQLSEKRRWKKSPDEQKNHPDHRIPYDLLIISDVASPDISNPFRFHHAQERTIGSYSLKKLKSTANSYSKALFWGPILLIAVSILLGFLLQWGDTIYTGLLIATMLLGMAILFGKWLLFRKLNVWLKDLKGIFKSLIGKFFLEKLSILNFQNIEFRKVEQLLVDRINSTSLMVQEVFLKQVRRLKYKSIYEDKLYENRRISNLIKELTRQDWEKSNDYQNLNNIDPMLRGSHKSVIGRRLDNLANEASSFGTTLWFTEQDKLDDKLNKLVALGQATMCFNIMIHISKIRNDPGYRDYSRATKVSLTEVFNKCKSDCKRFKKDPLFLIKSHAST